ncbi:SpoIIE family protein phosphatase [Streptomyces sp. H34-S4]|uniref:SpoIIE family protein phosphatase n=1 Tax=Streptomyces sp. H34-S4 TaxID=2996463 RepID=UPI00226D829B|nr:SpoIIE family protein phosphatase [Streptomyces sp. H34-S4]MCY0934953.1 SpoIIE family protein phosphatase [Streptomyces sp. H34-S4]
MNRFARLATRLLSAPQGLVWLNAPGETAGAAPECWPAELPVAPAALDCCRQVAELGQPLFLPVAGDGPLAFSFAGVPLVGSAGELLGVLAVTDVARRAWSADEARDLTDLAGACSAQIRTRMRSGAALQAREDAERAAYAAEGEATRMQTLLDRSQLLLRASEDLADTRGLDDVRRQVGELVSGDLKPSYIGMALLRQGTLHRVVDPIDGDMPFEDVPEHYALDPNWPTARAVRENRMIVINDRAELTAAYGPEAVAGFDTLDLRAAACLPLRGTRGTLGTLVLGWSSPYRIDVAERAILTTIAGYAAQAVERALHLDERVSAARELQQALLTELPDVPGLELAALYWPAAQDDMVGGDWYDAYPLPASPGESATGALAVTVADIAGHDIRAAALMGQVRSMLRQADHDHPGKGPEQVLSALERACRRLDLPVGGTLVHAHLRPEADGHWLLKWSNAGHPPPLLATPGGAVEQLTPHDVLLHPSLSPGPRSCETRLLAPGSTLVLYTDGLVEERGRDIEENIDRVARRLAAQPPDVPLETLLRSLGDIATNREGEDDTVLLALRIRAR